MVREEGQVGRSGRKVREECQGERSGRKVREERQYYSRMSNLITKKNMIHKGRKYINKWLPWQPNSNKTLTKCPYGMRHVEPLNLTP